MHLYIPSVGDKIRLTSNWTFNCISEERNINFLHTVKKEKSGNSDFLGYSPYLTSLPTGTELKVDRIYIRKGKKDYDSITFLITHEPGREYYGKNSNRFWVKLKEANNIEFEIIN